MGAVPLHRQHGLEPPLLRFTLEGKMVLNIAAAAAQGGYYPLDRTAKISVTPVGWRKNKRTLEAVFHLQRDEYQDLEWDMEAMTDVVVSIPAIDEEVALRCLPVYEKGRLIGDWSASDQNLAMEEELIQLLGPKPIK